MRSHLQPMPLGRRAVGDYASLAGEEQIERLRAAAESLRGARVLHLAAAGSRLRSPELLPAQLSIYRDLGLDPELLVLAGERPLWRLVQQLEDALQGAETAIADDAWAEYVDDSRAPEGFDYVVAHGPGPLASLAKAGAASVWRCELDCSRVSLEAWERLRPLVNGCDAVALPAASYAPPGTAGAVAEIGEAIDPLGPGSVDLPVRLAGSMLRSLGVDLSRPYCCQARPFDSWQDPHDVLDAFDLASEEAPGLQLVLAGDPAHGDVEAWRLLREVSDYADTRSDVLLLTGPSGLGNVELNALRSLARVGLESSLAPGSAHSALETMWKGTPVVCAGACGAAHPVTDGREGYVTDSPEATADRLLDLVYDPGLSIEMGCAGRELVRERHLVPMLAEKELRLLASFQSS